MTLNNVITSDCKFDKKYEYHNVSVLDSEIYNDKNIIEIENGHGITCINCTKNT